MRKHDAIIGSCEESTMAYIHLPEGLPGIRGLLAFRPETAKPLRELADALLHQPGPLSPGERELIASYVSHLNDCAYCHASHAAIAACHLQDEALVTSAIRSPEQAQLTEKMRALLALAGRVQESGRAVRSADVDRARSSGATDVEIHDTVLIAAAFCMFNRYVDGLATWTPTDPESYRERAGFVAAYGYAAAPPAPPAPPDA
jgi:uncharacterized peroxidase-related enzyme